MKLRKMLVLLAAVAFADSFCFAAPISQTFTIVNPGPLDSSLIVTSIFNDDNYEVLFAIFDTTGTSALNGSGPLVFGGLGSVTDPSEGTSSLILQRADRWHFFFTGFTTGKSFTFSWNPDTASDPGYSAVVAELAGIEVSLGTTGGLVYGTMHVLDDSVGVTLDLLPVPEPGTAALIVVGLIGLICFRCRVRSQVP